MITLTHLRALLERALTHTENPAILRLPEGERTVVGISKAYLSRLVWFDSAPHPGPDGFHSPHREVFNDRIVGCLTYNFWMGLPLDLTDPGTAHALLVALALALGLDPGVGGLSVRWVRNTHNGDWHLFAAGDMATFAVTDEVPYAIGATLCAPTVAAEPDPLRALALAVMHLLENP